MKVEDTEQALTEAVCSRVREQLDGADAELAEAFARQLYRWVAPEDVAERDPLDLYGLAVGHFNFARERPPGAPKVRAYNPRFEEHGWQSTHTAVEVVTDDMPFLIDSVSMELNRQGFGVHLIIHPVLTVRRDWTAGSWRSSPPGDTVEEGTIRGVGHPRRGGAPVGPGAAGRNRAAPRARHRRGPRRRGGLGGHARATRSRRRRELAEDGEPAAFLEWLADDNFTFLGYRDSNGRGSGSSARRRSRTRGRARPGDGRRDAHEGQHALHGAPGRVSRLRQRRRPPLPRPLHAHRLPGEPDRDPDPAPSRRGVLERAAFPPGSHNEKALLEILDTYPRDELFQISEDELFEAAMGILHLGERQRLRLFARRDPYGRFFSLLVFVPRDRFNTENRRRIEAILRTATSATSIDYTTRVSESVLVRLHFVAYVEPRSGLAPEFDPREVEMMLVAATRSWSDDLEEALLEELGEARGGRALPALRRRVSRRPTGPTGWPARRSPTSCTSRSCPRATGSGSASTGRSRPGRACCAPSCSAPGAR